MVFFGVLKFGPSEKYTKMNNFHRLVGKRWHFFFKPFHMMLANKNCPSGSKTRPHIFFSNFITFDPIFGVPLTKKALNLQ